MERGESSSDQDSTNPYKLQNEEKLHIHKEHESKVLDFMECLGFPFLKPLEMLLPINVLPELCFFVIIVIFFIATDFILTVVSVMSVYT